MSRNKFKTRWGLNKKSLVTIIIFTLMVSALMCVGGSLFFDKAIEELYNEQGYVVANIILEHIDHDKIAEYARTWKEDDYYKEMSDYLKTIQDCSEAAYIYIGVPSEDRNIKYIYDSGSNMGFVDPIAAPFDEIWRAYKEGVKPDSYLVRKSQYGYLTSSCLPVKDSSGETVALLFVDTDMKIILSTLRRYVFNMIVTAVILLSIFSVLHWYFTNRGLIHPLRLIERNVMNFASNNAQNDDTLKNIKSNDELEELAASINKMENDIAFYIKDIQIITAEKERISAELDVARRIQSDMLPGLFPPYPERKEFDIYASMTPAKEVGGDFYDFFLIDDDHLAMVIADVSGKGVPAALFMVITKTLLKYRTITGEMLSPAEILNDVNNRLCEGNEEGFFVTVWLSILQISTGKGVAANAGHEHPVIKRDDGNYELVIYKHSPAVAAMENTRFKEHEFVLNPGDRLFVYTDGVSEATDINNVLFGEERLLEALNSHVDYDTETLLKSVKTEIDIFVGEAPQFDDITMLEFRYYGGERA